ncbi:cation diffusion facilitator family transporter [Acidobacteria bacterium Mor1]|nr:cation diffusion facilitator family transporter [Acidobacteria bacterium Mor1]
MQHGHTFGQDKRKPGERRTLFVVGMTAVMMVVEIAAGLAYGSMALLADGLHMASHTVALTISVAAYVAARRFARDTRFSFGTGKINALAGYTSAVLLALFSFGMAYESIERLLHPVAISFDQAIIVAVIGLLVNGLSAVILGGHGHGHGHGDDHDHHHGHQHDHNLRGAYLHVMADAVTSLTAIFALLAGRFYGLNWLDPVMGIAGSLLVGSWSISLLRQSGRVLLDRQMRPDRLSKIRQSLEGDDGARVVDLHAWSIGPGIFSVLAVIVADAPLSPETYRKRLAGEKDLVHITVEVHPSTKPARPAAPSD